jgi:hypothetical protein
VNTTAGFDEETTQFRQDPNCEANRLIQFVQGNPAGAASAPGRNPGAVYVNATCIPLSSMAASAPENVYTTSARAVVARKAMANAQTAKRESRIFIFLLLANRNRSCRTLLATEYP